MNAMELPARDVVVGSLLALDQFLDGAGTAASRARIGELLKRLQRDGLAPLEEEREEAREESGGNAGHGTGIPDWLVDDVDRGLGRIMDLLSDPQGESGPHAAFLEAVYAVPGLADSLDRLHDTVKAEEARLDLQARAEAGLFDVTVVLRGAGSDEPDRAWVVGLRPDRERDAAADQDGEQADHDRTARDLLSGPKRWRSVSPATNRAFAWAAGAVRDLMEDLGVEREPRREAPSLSAMGLLPPSRIEDDSVALPAALRTLARSLAVPELPYPRTGVLAAGSQRPQSTAFERMSPEEAGLRARATGGSLIHPGRQGWYRSSAGGGAPVLLVEDRELTLAGAARAYWGADWDAWARRRHQDALSDLGWYAVDWETPRPASEQPLPDIRTEQVDNLLGIFGGDTRKVAVLGGPSGTGKSCIARCLARDLTEQGRRVLILAPENREFPTREMLRQVIRHALGASEDPAGTPGSGPVLVVLDGIGPMGESDVDSTLPHVSNELDVGLLALLQYDIHSLHEWRAEGVTVVPSIVRPAALEHFVEKAREQCAKDVAGSKKYIEALCRRHPHDLRRFSLGLTLAAKKGIDTPEALDRYLTDLFDDLDPAVQRQAAVVAAVSLLGGDARVAEPSHWKGLEKLGATRQRREHHCRFLSPADCNTVLSAYAGTPGGQDQRFPSEIVVELAVEEVAAALDDDLHGPLTALRGARLHSDALCKELAEQLRDHPSEAFQKWERTASPVHIAVLLLAVDSSLSEPVFSELLSFLLRRLPESTAHSGRELLPAVRAVLRYRHRIGDEDLQRLVHWMKEQFQELLDGEPGTGDRLFSVLDRFSRFDDPDLDDLVARRGAEILVGLDPLRALDYRTVSRVEKLVRKARRTVGDPVDALWVEHAPEVQKLLDHDPEKSGNIALFVASFVLRLRFDPEYSNWEPVLKRHSIGLGRALRRAEASELHYALEEAREYDRAFVTRLLNDVPGFGTAIRESLSRGALPTEAAMLLRSTSEIHDLTARDALYVNGGERPDHALAKRLAEQVIRSNDAKGAGLLLSATARVDDLFHTGARGFAQDLADGMGETWVRRKLEEDPRISVQYHLIKGIWEAEASYREDCLQLFVDVTAKALKFSMRPWGPQTALLIGQDEEFGMLFVDALSRQVSEDRLLEGMAAHSADARRQFHRLGRAMYAGAPGRYVREHSEEEFTECLRTASPSSAAQCARDTMRTLVDGGVAAPDAGRYVLLRNRQETVEQAGQRWAGRLHRGSSCAQVTEVLNVLSRLDSESASAALDALLNKRVLSRSAVTNGLQEHLRQAMFNDPVEATRLLSTVERVSAGSGVALMVQAQQDTRAWNAYTRELGHIQHPTQQYAVVRQLVDLGLRSNQAHSAWVEKLRGPRHVSAVNVTSPAALTNVIRMALIWDPDWARELAAAISGESVARRIGQGRRVADLTHTPGLLAVLRTVGADNTVRLILDALEKVPPTAYSGYLDLRTLDHLMVFVRDERPDLAYVLAPVVAETIGGRMRRKVVFDEAQHWREIGWAARSLHLVNRQDLIPRATPGRLPNPAHPYATAWGVMWLPEQRWTTEALAKAREHLLRPDHPSPGAAFVALAYASRSGRTSELRADDGSWPQLAGCGARSLAVLQQMAVRDGALKAALRSRRGELLPLMDRPAARVDSHLEAAKSWFIGVDRAQGA